MNKFTKALSLFAVLCTTGLSNAALAHDHNHGHDHNHEIARGETEIQVFLGYRGFDDYDSKLVSTFDNVVSAGWVHIEIDEEPVNGACYKGDPNEALRLFKKMVRKFNREEDRNIKVWGEHYYDESIKAGALRIYEKDETGYTTTWFPRMRECIRWSTPEERADSFEHHDNEGYHDHYED